MPFTGVVDTKVKFYADPQSPAYLATPGANCALVDNELSTPIYSCTSEKKNWQRMGPRYYFSPLIRLSNEPKNKKVQLAVFEKIRFVVFPYVN